ncbi:MAG: hypothetical protein LUQ71_02800 [Methanoregula sp.]|nr:hypothetical protein [Methanoregula sp.]
MDIIWPVFFPLLAALISIINITARKYRGTAALENFLMWQLAVGLGLSLIYGGLGHLVFPDRVAESIGWATGSPFQREVGIWDAAMGITGLLCLKFRGDFWTAVVIGPGLFYFCAGLGHVWELVASHNTAPNNAGGVMYIDLLYPVFLAVLLICYRKKLAGTMNSTT